MEQLDWRCYLLLAVLALPLDGWAAPVDPVSSEMWDYHHARLLHGEAFVFDPQIKLQVPPFAEDARQVPLQVDASAYAGQVVRMLAWAELNPIAQIFDFRPGEQVVARLAIRIRVEQATPIRAAVLTRDGLWHIGSAQVDAAGGGCTAPSVVRAEAGWEERLGQVLGKRYPLADSSRLRSVRGSLGLCAAALLAAFAAQAQSQVSIYGNLDVAVGRFDAPASRRQPQSQGLDAKSEKRLEQPG